MKKNIVLLVYSLISIGLYSQSTEVENILKEFSNKIKNQKTIYTKFIFSNLNQNNEVLDSFEGEMYLKKDKFKLLFPGNEIISDGKILWQYMEEVSEVTISEKEDDEGILSNPKKIFTIYEYEFKYKLNQEITINNTVNYEIDLFPIKIDESNYSRIRLLIGKSDMVLSSIKYFSKDGNIYTIIINDFKTDLTLDDSIFEFDAKNYPGVEINDMR